MDRKEDLSTHLNEMQGKIGILIAENGEINGRLALTVRQCETKDSLVLSLKEEMSALKVGLAQSERQITTLQQECSEAKDEVVLLRDNLTMTTSQTAGLKVRNDELEVSVTIYVVS
jgi:chromosome segregation ATPase